jgi:hypothetical protein
MKTIALQLVGLLALGIGGAGAQPYSLTGHVVAGGGGAATGGRFQITGTIGQAEAGPRLNGGCLTIVPGFWSAYAVVPTPGAPELRVRPVDANYVRVSFTPGCGNWVLQWTRVLENNAAATVWTDDAAGNLMMDGGELVREFHVPSWGPRLFFRLRQP